MNQSFTRRGRFDNLTGTAWKVSVVEPGGENMLDQNDLMAIGALMDGKLQKLEASMDAKLQKIDAKVERLDKKVESLDKKVESLDKKVESLDSRMTTLSKRVDRNYRILDKKIDARTDFLLDEINRVLVHKLDRIWNNLQVLNEGYAVQQIEHKNMTMMVEQLVDLKKRVERLEAKSA